jgi:DNA-binding response OmpR family regulator
MISLSKKTILVVDDDQDWRERASDCLAKAGYEVFVASDASEAMRQAEEPRVGLIIVDDNLAGESGLMLTRFLHRNRPEVPILLYTSFAYDDVIVAELHSQGADQCLPKGGMDELIVTVGCYIS